MNYEEKYNTALQRAKERYSACSAPATKKQCDLLFEKMKQAGYEWNAKNKELKKIESKKLDIDKVISWVKNTFPTPDMLIDKFKKDFSL